MKSLGPQVNQENSEPEHPRRELGCDDASRAYARVIS